MCAADATHGMCARFMYIMYVRGPIYAHKHKHTHSIHNVTWQTIYKDLYTIYTQRREVRVCALMWNPACKFFFIVSIELIFNWNEAKQSPLYIVFVLILQCFRIRGIAIAGSH